MMDNIAIVGLGQLGRLFSGRMNPEVRTLLVSSDSEKAEYIAAGLPNAEALPIERLHEANIIVLALPAKEIPAFFKANRFHFRPDAWIINPATMMVTDELRANFSDYRWIAMKMLGSVKEIDTGKRCLLITDDGDAADKLQYFFKPLGDVLVGEEHWVAECNSIATYHAINACMSIEEDIRRKGLPEHLIRPAATLVAKGLIQSYMDQTLAHFGKSILEQVIKDRENRHQK